MNKTDAAQKNVAYAFFLKKDVYCVRDWKGERSENKRLRLVGGESRSPEKPDPPQGGERPKIWDNVIPALSQSFPGLTGESLFIQEIEKNKHPYVYLQRPDDKYMNASHSFARWQI